MSETPPIARRALGLLAGALAAGAAVPVHAQRSYDGGAAPVRYPDADIVAIDPKRFKAMPGASRPSTVGRNGFAIVITVVVIGAVLLHLT